MSNMNMTVHLLGHCFSELKQNHHRLSTGGGFVSDKVFEKSPLLLINHSTPNALNTASSALL